jgi:ribonuclease PH
MTQIHRLVTRREEISKEAVEILEDYLEMAKRGEIIAVAICAVLSDGGATHQASSTDHQITLLGAVGRLLHRMHVSSDSVTSGI